MPTRTHTGRHTHRRVEHHSREMAPIHFVRRNRTNFGSEPELMSRSLMCKSSSPTAKPIQSTHNPAQVQLCSLLHYLSCVPNSVRPPTANKTCIWRGINTRPYATTLKKKKKKRKIQIQRQHRDDGVCAASYVLVVFIPFLVLFFLPPWKSGTNDKMILCEVNVSLWFISFLYCFSTE